MARRTSGPGRGRRPELRKVSRAVRNKLRPPNPCAGVEFPVILKGPFRPHYMTWAEQIKIEEHAPAYPRNVIRIITETGLRTYRELAPLKRERVDLANKAVFIADSRAPTGVAEAPLADIAVAAVRSQIDLAGPGPWAFPSASKPAKRQAGFKKTWERTLRKSGIPYFRLHDLRHTAECGRSRRVGDADASADGRQGVQEIFANETPDEARGADQA
jgi:integrase